jgi:glycosyltransferase involved in cell wall biosynthesis
MRGLDPTRYDHRLLTGYCAEDEADYLETQAPDITATRIPGLGRALNARDDARAIPEIVKRINDFRPDVIHTHTAKAGVLGRVAAKAARSDAKLVHTYHGHLLSGYFSPRKTQAVTTIERLLARGTKRLVAVGPQVRDDLLAAGVGHPDQYVVIPPGLTLSALPDRKASRTALGLPPDAPVIALIGRITRIKRPDRFADAVEIVRDRHPEARFIVAGSGDLEGFLAQEVAKRHLPVSMLGWRSDIETLLAASDALMLTSDNEGTPLSLIQAALAGLPVVATDVGSVKDVVVDRVTGLLCAPAAQEVALGISRLITEPSVARELGHQARLSAEVRFGVSRLVGDHETLYADLVQRRP